MARNDEATHRFRPMPHQDSAADEGSVRCLSSGEVEHVFRDFAPDLLAFLIGVLRDVDLAHDALQQTFQRVAESGGSARPETLRGWLFQVAYREALQLRRQGDRETRGQRQFWEACRTAAEIDDPAWGLVHRELRERLRTAIEELPPEQRDVVERRIQDEATFAEISQITGTPLGTVLTRMRLALERLRKRLHDE
jgi:RNA polymerase sigma-70 factor (ECF subfamily)